MTSRKPSIQPRATKASLLRQKQQPSASGLVTAEPVKKPTEPPSRKMTNQINENVGASQGVKAFMAQQRARLQSSKNVVEEPVKKKKTFMTGAERYGGGGFEEKTVSAEPRKLQVVIKQAKASGKLDISSRGLTKLPEEVLKMYQVDPNSIVVDFSNTGDAWYDAVELTKFIASDNTLTEIDDRFGEEFGALTYIDFRDNRLTSLPDTLRHLKNLTSIILPYNQFEEIPAVLFQLEQLKELNLSHNQLKGDILLPKTSIERLDLSDNQIQNVLVDGCSFTKLNLSHNQLEKLPLLLGWTKLQELNVNRNRLKYLFSATEQTVDLPLLERLDAGNNYIATISQGKDNVYMPKLMELSLMTNKLQESGLTGLLSAPHIKTLDISSNQLKDIPSYVFNLHLLERLDVRGNQLHALPYELGKLEHLKTLHCEGNPMRAVTSMTHTQLIASLKSNYQQQLEENKGAEDPSAEDPSAAVVEEEHADVDQDEEAINDLSNELSQKVNISKKLDLSNKQLSEFPSDSINFAEDIPGTILLDHNVFTLFPSYLNTISKFIVHLNLEHNRLSSFTFTIEGVTFTHLKTLKLSNNRLKSIECVEDTPSSFPQLEELSMNYNALTTLPNHFAAVLPRLRVLSLSSNKLDNIDEQQFSHSLEVLDLSNNDIGFLPPGLSRLEHLKELLVFGNRFRIPRPAVVDQGTKAILDFLKRRS